MKINFYPYDSNDNLYLSIVINSIRDEGVEVEPFVVSIRDWLLKKRVADVVHFNWFENIDAENRIKTLMRYGKRVVIIKILKWRKIKMVTTVHNRLPHNTKYKNLSLNFMKILYKNTDVITILSGQTRDILKEQFGERFYRKIETKIEYVPHPNYIGAYPAPGKEILAEREGDNPVIRFLFLGAVKPYKNVELILEAAKNLAREKKAAEFIIAGSGNKQYISALKKQYEELNNVVFLDKFIENEEINDLMSKSDVLILPYDKKSSMNSGTCFLAFTYKKNVVCPDIATIIDVGMDKCYAYSYVKEEDHFEKMLGAVHNVYDDYIKNKERFNRKGEALYDLVERENAPNKIGEMYRTIYERVVEG